MEDNNAFGAAVEGIIIRQMEKQTGMKVIGARYGSNNGIDLLLADSDVASEVTRCVVAEIKATRATQNAKWTFGKTVAGNLQMTKDWLFQIRNSLPPGSQGQRQITRITDNGPGLIVDKVTTYVDGLRKCKYFENKLI